MGSRNPEHFQAAATKLQVEHLPVEAITIDISADDSEVEAQFGRLGDLINNTGISIDNKFKTRGSFRQLKCKTYNTNAFGVVQTTEIFLPLLERALIPESCLFLVG